MLPLIRNWTCSEGFVRLASAAAAKGPGKKQKPLYDTEN